MRYRDSTWIDRWVGCLLCILVGGVFGSLFCLDGSPVLGTVVFAFTVAVGLLLLLVRQEFLGLIGKLARFFW